MRYLATPEIALERHGFVGGILSAEFEFTHDPVHVTISGPKGNASAKELFLGALRGPAIYKQTEWYDSAEGKLPGNDLDLPTFPEPVAFLCANGSCSAPIRSVSALAAKLAYPH